MAIHLHDPPDIKHNRKPAAGITFDDPNFPTLIADCIELSSIPAPGKNLPSSEEA